MDLPVTLTVRGTLVPSTLEIARALHNDTAGSEAGIAAARALGNLSHKVYAPCTRSKHNSAKAGELLFLDSWVDARGIMEFFSNPHVQTQGGALFSRRDPVVWMPARGAFTYQHAAPMGRNERYLGMIRGTIASPEAAIEIFRAADQKGVREAKKRGLISHELFIKLNAPGAKSPLEILGLDLWHDFDGMTSQYSDEAMMASLHGVFTGAPEATVWEQPTGHWSEW